MVDPGCEQKLNQADLDAMRAAFDNYLRTQYTSPDARNACQAMANKFSAMIGAGRITRGLFDTEEGDPNHVPTHGGQYSRKTGNIHIEPGILNNAHTGTSASLQTLLHVVLHESAHALLYTHSGSGFVNALGLAMYFEYPFNHLQPGSNSCVKEF
jgi:hypothetical protein